MAKTPKPKAAPKKAAPAPAPPLRAGRPVVNIEWPTGTILLISYNGQRRVPTGVPIEVTADELAYLDRNGVPYAR